MVAIAASLVTTRLGGLQAREAEAALLADELEGLWQGLEQAGLSAIEDHAPQRLSILGSRLLGDGETLTWGITGRAETELWAAVEDGEGNALATIAREPSELTASMRKRTMWRVGLSAFMIAWIAFWGGVMLVNRAVDRLDEAQAAVLDTARRDPLTGLLNRQGFELRVRSGAKRRRPGWLFIIDIYRFRELNDAAGPEQGDAVLLEVANRIRNVLRDGAVASRIGADVFGLWLPDLDTSDEAHPFALELHKSLSAPYPLRGARVSRRLHIGMCPCVPGDVEVTGISRAETAMRSARELQVPVMEWTDDLAEWQRDAVELMAALEDAITRKTLDVHYQPVKDLKSGQWVSMEALVRWEHPERGSVSPGVFIPMAETHGLIKPITEFVLEHAATTLHRLHQRGGESCTVAVNLAALSLVDIELPDRISDIVRACNIDPSSMHLEITETSTFGDAAVSKATLTRLAELGFSIHLDDFGTGMSSLAHLRELPIDGIKIDRSFVMEATADGNERDASIIAATIHLAHSLGLCVVGEGVETDEMLRMLTEFGCDYAQGFGLHRPAPREAVLAAILGESVESDAERTDAESLVHRAP